MAEGPNVDVEKLRKNSTPEAGKLNNLEEVQAGIKSRKAAVMGKGPIRDDNGVLHPAMYERSRTMKVASGEELGPFPIVREDR